MIIMDTLKYIPTIYGSSGQPLLSLDGDVDFDELQERLSNNRTAGYVYSRHKHELNDNTPSELVKFFKVLKRKFRENQYRNTILLSEAVTLFSALEDNNITWVAVKGVSLIPTAYRDIGSRKMGDIDILVSPDDKERTIELFSQLGYEWKDSGYPLRSPLELTKKVGANNVNVDLAWRPLHRSISVESEGVLELLLSQRQVIHDDLCGNIAIASPEAQIIYISGNITLHNDNASVTGLLDLYELLTHHNVDWQLLLDEATAVNLDKALLLSLMVVKRLFNIQLPDSIIEEAAKVIHLVERTPALVYFEKARLVEDYAQTSVLQRDGGLRKNVARLYWRSIIDSPSNSREYFQKYIENKATSNFLAKSLVIPVVTVILSSLLLVMRPLFMAWMVDGKTRDNYAL